jgi:hypothetical protein
MGDYLSFDTIQELKHQWAISGISDELIKMLNLYVGSGSNISKITELLDSNCSVDTKSTIDGWSIVKSKKLKKSTRELPKEILDVLDSYIQPQRMIEQKWIKKTMNSYSFMMFLMEFYEFDQYFELVQDVFHLNSHLCKLWMEAFGLFQKWKSANKILKFDIELYISSLFHCDHFDNLPFHKLDKYVEPLVEYFFDKLLDILGNRLDDIMLEIISILDYYSSLVTIDHTIDHTIEISQKPGIKFLRRHGLCRSEHFSKTNNQFWEIM